AEFDESDTYVLERLILKLEILSRRFSLKLNPLDHKSILTDLQVTPTKHGRMTKSYSPYFIANCFNAGYLKMEVKAAVQRELQEMRGRVTVLKQEIGRRERIDLEKFKANNDVV
nr:hypothetical protein [Tanacetum cinerariifolium]